MCMTEWVRVGRLCLFIKAVLIYCFIIIKAYVSHTVPMQCGKL